jgi:hypothetical protein
MPGGRILVQFRSSCCHGAGCLFTIHANAALRHVVFRAPAVPNFVQWTNARFVYPDEVGLAPRHVALGASR